MNEWTDGRANKRTKEGRNERRVSKTHPDACNLSFLLELPFSDKLEIGPAPPVQLAHASETNALIKEAAATRNDINRSFVGSWQRGCSKTCQKEALLEATIECAAFEDVQVYADWV